MSDLVPSRTYSPVAERRQRQAVDRIFRIGDQAGARVLIKSQLGSHIIAKIAELGLERQQLELLDPGSAQLLALAHARVSMAMLAELDIIGMY